MVGDAEPQFRVHISMRPYVGGGVGYARARLLVCQASFSATLAIVVQNVTDTENLGFLGGDSWYELRRAFEETAQEC